MHMFKHRSAVYTQTQEENQMSMLSKSVKVC